MSNDNDFAAGVSTLFSEQKEAPKLPSADIQNVMKAIMTGMQPGTLEYFKALGAEAEQNGIIPTNKLGPLGWIRDAYSTDAQNIIKKQSALTDLGFRIQNDMADAFSKREIARQTAPTLGEASAIAPFLSQTATPDQQVRPLSTMQVQTDLVPPTFDIDQLQPDAARFQARQTNKNAMAMTATPQDIDSGALTRQLDAPRLNITGGPSLPELRPLDVYGQPQMDPNARMNPAQLAAYQSMLAGHVVDPRGPIVPPSLQASRETPVEVNPGNTLTSKGGVPLYTAPGKPVKDNEELRKFEGVLEAAGIAKDSPMGKQLYTEWAKKIANPAPGTQVTTNVSTEKSYGTAFAGKIADQDSALMDTAQKAPDFADRANRIISVLNSGKVITGTGAEFRLSLAKAMKLAGLAQGEGIEETETLVSDLSSNTLDAIKASGLGGGSGFSNADREFLEKAKGGKITMEAGSLKRLAELAYRAAQKSAERWNERVKRIPKSALEGTGIGTDPIRVPPMFRPAPKVGSVENGYRFKGGDASQRGNWEKVN